MMKKHLFTALALVSVSSFAWAGSDSVMFQNLDANHDGQISADEVKNAPDVANSFNQADVNKDGKLDASEFSALETQPKASMPNDGTLNNNTITPNSPSTPDNGSTPNITSSPNSSSAPNSSTSNSSMPHSNAP